VQAWRKNVNVNEEPLLGRNFRSAVDDEEKKKNIHVKLTSEGISSASLAERKKKKEKDFDLISQSLHSAH
jgi:hypothetical protein